MGKSGFIGRLVSAYYPARWQAAAWTVNLFGVRGGPGCCRWSWLGVPWSHTWLSLLMSCLDAVRSCLSFAVVDAPAPRVGVVMGVLRHAKPSGGVSPACRTPV